MKIEILGISQIFTCSFPKQSNTKRPVILNSVKTFQVLSKMIKAMVTGINSSEPLMPRKNKKVVNPLGIHNPLTVSL
jgi:hypothetical protein